MGCRAVSTYVRRVAFTLLALLAACSQATAPQAPPVPGGGTVAGRLIAQRSDGSHRAAVAGQAVGAFTEAVIPGKVLQHPPSPIATAVTSPDGGFTLHRLSPGRYFITVDGNGPPVAGYWVTVTSGRGASVLLIHCTDCPTPR
jgi:hypothetical protein